jgi:hypothetical protein
MRPLHRFVMPASLALAAACAPPASDGEAEEATGAAGLVVVADVGFLTPESVLHDSAADVYLVTNINGSPLATDDNGFISRVTPDGSVQALKWIDGAAEHVRLDAPKGMGIRGDSLFVADITALRIFHRVSGEPMGSWPVSDATFLNDVAVGPDGTIYVTDTGLRAGADGAFAESGTDALYRFGSDGTPEQLTGGTTLGRPNGIAVGPERIALVSFGSGAVFLIDPETGRTSGLPSPPSGQLDGVVFTETGAMLISSWEGQAVYRMMAGGQYEVMVDSVEAPADIGYDARRRRLLIPLFTANRVEVHPLP